jgi:6-phosphogluconolactonase
MTWDSPQSRRDFLAAAVVAGLAVTRRTSGHLETGGDVRAPWTMYIGTYTKTGKSKGIYRVAVDPVTLQFGTLELAAETPDPSFLALTPDGSALVAVNELVEFGGQASGSVTVFARHAASGALTALSPSRTSRGAAPCYVSIDRTGRQVMVANYVGGNVAVLPLAANGALGEAGTVLARTGKGPHPVRQVAPHAHCIVPDAGNRFVLMSDLGTDKIHIARLDAATGALTPAEVPEVALRPGSGPRHLAFSPDGQTLYVVTELDSTIVAFAYNRSTGGLTERQRISTRPAGANVENFPADLHVHPTGRTVYASNRGDDTIAVFSVDPANKSLSLVQSVPTGGNGPRNFALTPDGAGLLVANQRSDSILAFQVDAVTGQLAATGQKLEAPVPVCLTFA